MRGCGQLLAGFLAFFFIISGVTALFLYNLIVVVTDRDAVKQALSGLDQAVQAAMPLALADMVQQTAVEHGLHPIPIDEAELATAVTEFIPEGWIETQADTAVDSLYNFLETGDSSQATINLDMAPFVQSLRGDGGQQLITAVVNQLPPCSQPIPEFDPQSGDLPACLPPQISSEQLVEQMHTAVVQAIDANPQLVGNVGVVQIPLFGENSAIGLTAEHQAEALRLQQTFMRARNLAWLLWLPPVLSLFLILVLAVRSLSEWGHWWGWPLVLTAVTGLLLSFLGPAVITFILRTAVTVEGDLDALSPLRPLADGIISTISDQWLGQLMVHAGLMFIAGAALISLAIVANFLKRHSANNPHIEYR